MRDPEVLSAIAERHTKYSDLCDISDNLLYFLSETKPPLQKERALELEQEAEQSGNIDEFLVGEAIKLFQFLPKKVSSIELRKNLIVLREPNIKKELVWDLEKISEFVERESGKTLSLMKKAVKVNNQYKKLVAEEAEWLWDEEQLEQNNI